MKTTAIPTLGAIAVLACSCSANPPGAQVAQAAGQRACFLASQVNDFDPVDADTARVTVGASRMYELELFGDCSDINWRQQIAIRSTGGSQWVCQGLDAELLVPSPMGPTRCLVRSVRMLSPAEVEAVKSKPRP